MRVPKHIAPTEDRIRIRHRVDGIVAEVLENVRAGKRFFSLHIPAVRLKHEIALRVMEALGRKTIVLTPNAAVQGQWLESSDGDTPPLADLAMRISDTGSAHTISALPFSCAPVLLLSYQRSHLARIEESRIDAEVERIVKHLVKHVYSLVLLDECDAPPPFWEKAIGLLRARSTAVILEFSCWGRAAIGSRGTTGNLPIRYDIPLTACIRESLIHPFQSYLYPARASAPETASAVPPANGSGTAAPQGPREDARAEVVKDVLLRVSGADPDGTRTLIVVEGIDEQHDTAGARAGTRIAGTSLFASLASDGRVTPLHPVVLTGSSFLCHDDLVIPMLAAAQKVINLYGWSLQITHNQQDEWSEVFGAGPDWNSRSYVRIAQQLLAERITRCLIADRGELRHGWEFLTVDAIVDLSAGSEFFSWNQQEHAPKSAGDLGRRLVTVWHLLDGDSTCAASDRSRLRNLYAEVSAPADDGVLERGFMHIHPGIRVRDGDVILPADDTLRGEMAARFSKRDEYLRLWEIGTPPPNEERMCLEFIPAPDCAATLPLASVQLRALEDDREQYHERARAATWQRALWGAIFSGSIMSIFLLLQMEISIVLAGIMALLYCFYALRSWFSLRGMRPSCPGVPPEQFLRMLGNVILHSRGLSAARTAARATASTENIVVTRRASGGLRVYLREGTYTESSLFARALSDLLQPVNAQAAFMRVFGVRTGTMTVRGLLKLSAVDTLLTESGLLPVPSSSDEESDSVHRYLEAARALLGRVELVSREDDADLQVIGRFQGKQLLAGEILFRTISV